MKKHVSVLTICLPLCFTAPGAVLAQTATSQKACSVFVPGNWRDTVTVSMPGWYTTQCELLSAVSRGSTVSARLLYAV